jgi:hypothetical protein
MKHFGTGPLIADLLLQHRMSVNEKMRAGKYGRTHRIGRLLYVDLAEVERAEGATFSKAQIETAGRGLPDRTVLTILEEKNGEEEHRQPA